MFELFAKEIFDKLGSGGDDSKISVIGANLHYNKSACFCDKC